MIPNSDTNHSVSIVRKGLHRAWAGAVWMYKIVIPVSFLTFLISFSHILEHLEGILGPVMGLLHLPSKAAMPLIAGMLTGIYGGIAAMAVLSFTIKQTTLIAVFLLISHALIQESAIQGKSGLHPFKAIVFRIAMAAIVVGILGLLWHGGQQANPLLGLTAVEQTTFMGALGSWCVKTLGLSLQILIILVVIMTANEWMKARRLAERLARFLKPLLKMMGLSEEVGLLWLTAMLFGITYGGAVIVEEVRKGTLSADDLQSLHLSIGINHAVIEDPALFLPLGIHPFWLWAPRWVAALVAVHLVRLWRRHSGRAVKKKFVSEEKAY